MFNLKRVLPVAALLPAFAVAQTQQQTPTPHPAFPQGTATALGAKIAALLGDPAVARAHWGIAVTTLDGTPLYGLDEGQFFRPASNAKLFTTVTALALLGPDSRVTTRLIAYGRNQSLNVPPVENGALKADLALVGAGDGNFGSDRTFPYRAASPGSPAPPTVPLLSILSKIAATLAQHGVTRITGDILGDDTLWPAEPHPDTWGLDDILWGYGAPVSALTVNDNQLSLIVSPGKTPGSNATASLSPEVGYYEIEAKIQTVAADQPSSLRVARDPASRIVHVSGDIALDKPYRTDLSIEDPAEFAAIALKAAFIAHGITVEGTARAHHHAPPQDDHFIADSRVPLANLPLQRPRVPVVVRGCNDNCVWEAVVDSPVLAEDVAVTLKESQNLHAELLLHRLGAAWGADGSAAQGTRVVRQWLINAGLDGNDFVFYDGSGLSSHDLVTPRATTQLLAFAATQPWFAQWKAALPLGGVDGTLEHRFTEPPLKGHVFAKTGTLGESRALSGYLDAASGKQIIFSIMADTHTPASTADRATMDKIVAAIAATQ